MSATFELEGDEEMMDKTRRLFPIYQDAAGKGAQTWADDVMNSSKREYVPVDTGALKASGYSEDATTTDVSITLELGYSQNYAAPVHENMAARHEVGQAKYLEIPLIIKSGELLPRIAQAMDRAAESEL